MEETIRYTFKCGWELTTTIEEAKIGNIHDKCPYCFPEQYKDDLKFFTKKIKKEQFVK